MMPKHKDFLDLQATWYSKLEKDGFKDIEQADGNLKAWTNTVFKLNRNAILDSAKEEYYRMAGHFLYDYKFETDVERTIWRFHSDGVSIRNIVKHLKVDGIKYYRRKVHVTIQKLRKVMFNKYRSNSAR